MATGIANRIGNYLHADGAARVRRFKRYMGKLSMDCGELPGA